MARKDLKNSTITIKDNGANSIDIKIGTGNLTWSENYPKEYEPERGSVGGGTVRDADEQPVEVNVTSTWENVVSEGSETATPYEALRRVGAAVGWVSTGVDPCEPYAVSLEIKMDVNCTGTSTKLGELVQFDEFRVEKVDFDISAGTLIFNGKSKQVSPTVTRIT